jgi:pterin-4a-carbinolamine dehydratase
MFQQIAKLSAVLSQAPFVSQSATLNAMEADTTEIQAEAGIKAFFSRAIALCQAVSHGADKWNHQ